MSVPLPANDPAVAPRGRGSIKVVVWDLDETLWHGVLLEDTAVVLREHAAATVRALDARGILQSVVSRNDPDTAMAKLRELGLAEFLLYPQIGWGSKSAAVERVRAALNVDMDTVAFVDDQPFERDEVAHVHPDVLCLDAADLASIVTMPELTPAFITEDSAMRRRMYLADAERDSALAAHDGPAEEFLATLGMRFTVAPCTEADLQRAEELTVRTNQLNTTGVTYSYEELDALRVSPDHLLLVASLEDRYGSYGRIGLALVEKGAALWTLKLLLMSCRVMARGVGTILLHHIMRRARDAGVGFRAEFRHNGRNRMMFVTYRLGGFRVAGEQDGLLMLEHPLVGIPPDPGYVDVQILP